MSWQKSDHVTFLETYEFFLSNYVSIVQIKVGKFQADQMLFVGMAG